MTANPYKQCPTFETEHFTLRLVDLEDAKDLLTCYSDPNAQRFFNVDNFPIDCTFNTVDEMAKYIKFWLAEYADEMYVRFSIIDKKSKKTIGTAEMFGTVGKYMSDPGILRIDIASSYESKSFLKEILSVCVKEFYELFKVRTIATKAIPEAVERVLALQDMGFCTGDFNEREHYYLRSKD